MINLVLLYLNIYFSFNFDFEKILLLNFYIIMNLKLVVDVNLLK